MSAASKPRVERAPFGKMPDGAVVERIVLRGAEGFEAGIIPYGAVLHTLHVRDRAGKSDDIVLGHDTFDEYLAQRKFLGATIGRYANRIAGAQFKLDGATFQLDANNGPNMLHGGHDGFDRKLWRIAEVEGDARTGSAAGLHQRRRRGRLSREARRARDLSSHRSGRIDGDVRGGHRSRDDGQPDQPQFLQSRRRAVGKPDPRSPHPHRAEHFLATDTTSIPLPGSPHPVAGTPFDFRKLEAIGSRIRTDHEQLRRGRGYDHNYCLLPGDGVRLAARVESPRSGRAMELLTNQPGLQFYSGNFLDGTLCGKGGRLYRQSDAFCVEPQAWPDTPNRPDFPSARLDPGKTYRHETVYRFSLV